MMLLERRGWIGREEGYLYVLDLGELDTEAAVSAWGWLVNR